MHPKEGNIYRMNNDGNWIWERPRTRREAGMLWPQIIIGSVAVIPFAIALMFMLS